ncbi:hypothetical protein AJ78_07659 [Emergomyces pasteurianus Ep9510]|uniref:Uncharacterized protein n=1 Tax=Emergomyces pasteurianus Ep9510 TaxID=1447872 RepID=A0A1J9PUR1_9EURO|nr:hypothetical protein AJ78_07659 [Emergomyces pasteurianus Ep9510]
MPSSDATGGLNGDQKRQLASDLYGRRVIDPDMEQKSSSALFSRRKISKKNLCPLHEKLKADLIEHLLGLIKFEVGTGINLYCAYYETLSETKQKLVNDLQQLNIMWTERAHSTEKHSKQTRQWRYQANQCNACIVGRVAQNKTALEGLQNILKARDRPHRGHIYASPRLLFWVEEFLHCHETKVPPRGGENCKLSRSKSMPHSHRPQYRPKPDWIDETIERWQQLGASTHEPARESHSDRDLEAYTPTKITQLLAVASMENCKRPSRSPQQSYGNPPSDKSNSVVNDRNHCHSHHNSTQNGTMANYPGTLEHELVSHGCTENVKPFVSGLEPPRIRRDSVTSLSSNYSRSPPATPVTERPTVCASRDNGLPVSPSTSVVRTAIGAGTDAGLPTGEAVGHYGGEGNFDPKLKLEPELEPDLAPELNSYIDAKIINEGARCKAHAWVEADATKMPPELEDYSPRMPEDSESEWDDDSVYDSDERSSHVGHSQHHGYESARPG